MAIWIADYVLIALQKCDHGSLPPMALTDRSIAQPLINRWCCDQRSLSPAPARNKRCCVIRCSDLLRNHVRSRIAIAGGEHRSPSLSRIHRCCCDQAPLSHAMKDNDARDQLSSISASVLSWLINRPHRPHSWLINGDVSEEIGTRFLFPRRAWTRSSCAWSMLMMLMMLMMNWPLPSRG